jgi:hypothetical protein
MGLQENLATRKRLFCAAGVVQAGLALTFVAGCQGYFVGPYPCETGYDSCINPGQNLCETNITNDAAHCGKCDSPCGIGALCTNSKCGPAAQKLATLPSGSSTPVVAVNDTNVVLSTQTQGQIFTIHISGGNPLLLASSVGGCGNQYQPFAIDQSNVYYWANGMTPCNTGNCTGMAKTAIIGGTPALLVAGSPNVQCPWAMAVDSKQLYWSQMQNSTMTVMGAPIAGGTATTLTTQPAGGSFGLALTSTSVVSGLYSLGNSPPTLCVVPTAGGTAKNIPLKVNGNFYGINALAAGADGIYAAGSGCACNNGNGSQARPTTALVRFALDGSSGTVIGNVTGRFNSIAVQGADVFVATETTVWRLPTTGGIANIVADNLAGGVQPYMCNGSCGMDTSTSSTVSIAVDPSFVYIADGSANVNAILRMHR